jgi:ABC-2 type transport system permease protein
LCVGAAVFGVYNQGSYAGLGLLVLLGASCFICMGYALSSFAGSVATYGGLSSLVLLLLMMLSGVYFSLDSAPLWLQQFVDVLPLAPLVGALRAGFNDGANLGSIGSSLTVLAAWTVVLFVTATMRFKWV